MKFQIRFFPKHSLWRFSNDQGQSLIEYLIIVAMMGIATLGIMRVLSQNVTAQFANITYRIQGEDNKVRFNEVSSKHTTKKDLSDFFEGAADEK